MNELRNQLINYIPDNESELNYKIQMQNLMDDVGTLAFSRNSYQAHFTASAWLVDQKSKKILLLHHRKLNKWLQPGGHADGELNLELVAKKEVSEETNLSNLRPLLSGIFDIDIHLIPEHKDIKAHYHYDVRYAFSVIDNENTQINNESKAFKWLSLEEVPKFTKNASILRMTRKTQEIFNR